MRAIQITELSGPATALRAAELPEPEPDEERPLAIEVRAAGVSFPEVLQTRGLYQIKPDLPFVPGSEVAGVVRSAPEGSPFRPGDRVASFCGLGGFAEHTIAPLGFTFPLPERLEFAQGAGLVMNYHTAYFALTTRGRLRAGERVLVHGAAGGVGTATVQVARALGAHVIALVSSDEKEEVARRAGAHEVLRTAEPWKDRLREGGGVDLVLDPVGGDRFTDSLRSLREGGRLVVVGFTAGSIPEVRVNRLLLTNTEVVGAGWGGHALSHPEATAAVARHLEEMIAAGEVAPIVGARFPLERASEALRLLDERGAVGKVVLDVA